MFVDYLLIIPNKLFNNKVIDAEKHLLKEFKILDTYPHIL